MTYDIMDKLSANLCPRGCTHLSLSEESQNENYKRTGFRDFHRCLKYDEVRLYHKDAHPYLYRCDQCAIDYETVPEEFVDVTEFVQSDFKILGIDLANESDFTKI